MLLKHRLQEADPENTGGQQQVKDPNEDWKKDDSLDDNGNPIEKTPAAKTEDTPADKPADKPEDKQEAEDTSAVSKTAQDELTDLIKDAGVSTKEMFKAINDNGGTVSAVHLKALTDKHGQAVGSLIADQLSNIYKQNTAKADKLNSEVYAHAEEIFKGVTEQSGEESWKELQTWSKTNVDEQTRRQYAQMIRAGGRMAKLAVEDMAKTFFETTNTQPSEGDLLRGDNPNADTGTGELSQGDYLKELEALESKGHVYGQSKAIERLDQRRARALR